MLKCFCIHYYSQQILLSLKIWINCSKEPIKHCITHLKCYAPLDPRTSGHHFKELYKLNSTCGSLKHIANPICEVLITINETKKLSLPPAINIGCVQDDDEL